MIQRLQTVFLLLTVLVLTIQAFTPLLASTVNLPQGFYQDGLLFIKEDIVSFGLLIAAGLVAFTTILLFKNLKLQKKLILLSFVLILGCILAGGFSFTESTQTILATTTATLSPRVGIFMPLVGLISLVLAYRWVIKDEKIIKSMDRLR